MKAELQAIDGFVSVERFESVTTWPANWPSSYLNTLCKPAGYAQAMGACLS
jgi:hypothetical protein